MSHEKEIRNQWWMVALVVWVLGCSTGPTEEPDADVGAQDVSDVADRGDTSQMDVVESDAEVGGDVSDDTDVAPESCQISHALPAGTSYALYVDEIREPDSVASLLESFMDDPPPMVMFLDGLSDGVDDALEIVGGFGERTGYGDDEIPDTHEDVYAMYYEAISEDSCDYRVRIGGQSIQRQLSGAAEMVELDLSGLSSLTDGVVVEVVDVTASGALESDLMAMHDVVLSGLIVDEALDDLVAAMQEQVSISEEQAGEILDPDGDDEVPIELVMSGRQVVVDGFVDAEVERAIKARDEAGPCCPEGLAVGDSVIPYLAWGQQGIDDRQAELLEKALPEFREDPHVAMVLTARHTSGGDVQYEVYSGGAVAEGSVIFERHAGTDPDAPTFELVDQQGVDPLANTDPEAISSLAMLSELGDNPNSVDYPNRGYPAGDSRLQFVPPESMHYPFAMERIAHLFDDPRAGDVVVVPASWSTGGFGTHGHLGSLQSRTPLVISGPGVRGPGEGSSNGGSELQDIPSFGQTRRLDAVARQVDIAPTVAAALGVEPTTGVGPDMRLRDDVYLAWQDGRILEEVFDEQALEGIQNGEPVADRALIIVTDGLTHSELLFQVFGDEPDVDIDSYRMLFEGGLYFGHGAIANFPSNSYPSHNTVGSGVWSGHHGIVDNGFWEREQGAAGSPRGEIFETEYMFGSAHANLPIETLHEAVRRSFGGLENDVLAASINNPSTRGAQMATFERRRPSGFDPGQAGESVEIDGEEYELPAADVEEQIQIMDNSTVQSLVALYQDHIHHGDEGLPVPRYAIINLGTTDRSGHRHGPHGDGHRQQGLGRTDQRLAVILESLKSLDLMESTLVVFTSDHGMELQDQSRSSSRTRAFDEAGVSIRRAGWFVYFKELDVVVESTEENGDDGEQVVMLRVIDRATAASEEPLGVEYVQVQAIDGGDSAVVQSDAEGYVELVVTPDGEGQPVEFEFQHGQWNDHRLWLDL